MEQQEGPKLVVISKIYKSTSPLLEVKWAEELTRRKFEKERKAMEMAMAPTQLEMLLGNRLAAVISGRVEVRKQFLIAGYIVDFYIPCFKLAIEADGPHHMNTKRYDDERDARLALLGVRTKRFTYKFLRHHMTEMIDREIRDTLNSRQKELRKSYSSGKGVKR